jgi:two-component system phosphate regulon response regulator PhoB
MARLLVIEDEPDVREVVSHNLTASGYEVSVAADGTEGLKMARELRPDLVLLDMMLPDISGTEVCRTLKGDPDLRTIPVMVVSALGEEIDRVVALELGADDYVTKPFSVRELVLRVRALLRRRASDSSSPAVEFGCMRIDRQAHRVWIDSESVILSPIELRLLLTMYDQRNRVQTREALLKQVWGASPGISARTVDAHVKRLRQKLGAARDYVETVRGIGYRFAGAPHAS